MEGRFLFLLGVWVWWRIDFGLLVLSYRDREKKEFLNVLGMMFGDRYFK